MPAPVIAAQTCDREVVTEYSSTTSRAVIQHDLTSGSNVYASLVKGSRLEVTQLMSVLNLTILKKLLHLSLVTKAP